MSTQTFYGDEIPLDAHIIEVRIRELHQLFDSLDPSPFIALDLDDDAQQYIVVSANEISPRMPLAPAIHVGVANDSPEEIRDGGEAIREHFIRQSGFADVRLDQLIRRGWISLGIGLAFLSAALTGSAALLKWVETSTLAAVFSEGLIICGWVAMWRPIEIFLYDWWPIRGERHTFDRLARMPVQILYDATPAARSGEADQRRQT